MSRRDGGVNRPIIKLARLCREISVDGRVRLNVSDWEKVPDELAQVNTLPP